MWVILAGVIGCYALVAAAVHLAHKLTERRPRRADQYVVLVTKNNQARLEGAVRRLQLWSFFTGVNWDIIVVDRGSEDDTAAIASRLGDGIKLLTDCPQPDGTAVQETPQAPAEAEPLKATGLERETEDAAAANPGSAMHGLLERYGIAAEHAVVIVLEEPESPSTFNRMNV